MKSLLTEARVLALGLAGVALLSIGSIADDCTGKGEIRYDGATPYYWLECIGSCSEGDCEHWEDPITEDAYWCDCDEIEPGCCHLVVTGATIDDTGESTYAVGTGYELDGSCNNGCNTSGSCTADDRVQSGTTYWYAECL